LMRLVRNESRRSIRMIFNKNCQVYTHSLTNWSSFQLQRKRWALGTRGRDLLTYSLLVLALLAPILILILFISGNVSLSIASLSVLFAADLFLFSRILSLSGQMNLLIFVPLFRMFQIFYFLVLLPSFFWRNKIDWKESKYDATR